MLTDEKELGLLQQPQLFCTEVYGSVRVNVPVTVFSRKLHP